MKAWLTFRAGVVLPSRPRTTARGRGVGTRSGGECSVFCEREGESWLLRLREPVTNRTSANRERFGLRP